ATAERLQLVGVAPVIPVLDLDPAPLAGAVRLRSTLANDPVEALCDDASEEHIAVPEDGRHGPGFGTEMDILEKAPAVRIRESGRPLALKLENVKDHVRQRHRAVAVEEAIADEWEVRSAVIPDNDFAVEDPGGRQISKLRK